MIKFQYYNMIVVYDEKTDSYKLISSFDNRFMIKVDREFIKNEDDFMRKMRYITIYREIYKRLGKEFKTEGLFD